MDLALDLSVDELVLGVAGWSYGEGGLSPCQLAEFITYLIYNNYTFNGGKVKRQIMGMPMGMPAAPQIANLACYPVEREHSYVLGPGKSMTVCRYIDDFYASGVPLPPKEAYGMDYGMDYHRFWSLCCVSWSESLRGNHQHCKHQNTAYYCV